MISLTFIDVCGVRCEGVKSGADLLHTDLLIAIPVRGKDSLAAKLSCADNEGASSSLFSFAIETSLYGISFDNCEITSRGGSTIPARFGFVAINEQAVGSNDSSNPCK